MSETNPPFSIWGIALKPHHAAIFSVESSILRPTGFEFNAIILLDGGVTKRKEQNLP